VNGKKRAVPEVWAECILKPNTKFVLLVIYVATTRGEEVKATRELVKANAMTSDRTMSAERIE
jgi:hypothetical protein